MVRIYVLDFIDFGYFLCYFFVIFFFVFVVGFVFIGVFVYFFDVCMDIVGMEKDEVVRICICYII